MQEALPVNIPSMSHGPNRWRPGATRRRALAAEAAVAACQGQIAILTKVVAALCPPVEAVAFGDPVVLRIQARRRRVEASGLSIVR
jgi:hypothetical protein